MLGKGLPKAGKEIDAAGRTVTPGGIDGHCHLFNAKDLSTVRFLSYVIAKHYPKAIFFAGKLVFEEERWYQRLLHNETGYQLQRRLQFAGLNAMVLPVRVITSRPTTGPAVLSGSNETAR